MYILCTIKSKLIYKTKNFLITFMVKSRNPRYPKKSGGEMTNKDDVDVLFGIRNAFYAGNYQSCITEAQKIKKVLIIVC